jgi:hypothetical protein
MAQPRSGGIAAFADRRSPIKDLFLKVDSIFDC